MARLERAISLVVTAALALGLRLAHASPGELCLTGGQTVDPDTRAVRTADVVIAGGVITRVGPAAGAHCHGQRLDVSGRFLLPGLIDAHVHGWGNPSPTDDGEEDLGAEAVLALVLQAGVMATLDLAGSDPQRIAVRNRLRGSPDHAALLVGSALMARPPRLGKATPSAATDSALHAQLRADVRARAALRPDVIKIIAAGGPIEPIISEARRLGLPTVVHIPTWADAAEAVRAGASAITHFEDEQVIPDDLLARWAALGARAPVSIPTMAVQCDFARFAARPALLDDPLLARMSTPALRAAYRDSAHFSRKAEFWVRWQSEGCVANDFVTLRALHRRGVKLLAGADTGNLGTFQGFSLHREMELMVEAGLDPWDALRAATTHPAAFLGLAWGLRARAPANLLVLAASPLADIRNTRRLVHVIHRGHVVALAPTRVHERGSR